MMVRMMVVMMKTTELVTGFPGYQESGNIHFRSKVLNCFRGVKMSSLGCNGGTGSQSPGTVALSEKNV